MIKLGVNIDHVATVRQARRGPVPDLLAAAEAATRGGADGITIHLREDRRHIQDADLFLLAPKFRVNLEMAATKEMVGIAIKAKPHSVCLVPERRAELTTEGGLNVVGDPQSIRDVTRELRGSGIIVSHFIDPDPWQIAAAAHAGAEYIELHTGKYADAKVPDEVESEFRRLLLGAQTGISLGLRINAGHGLDLRNVPSILHLKGLEELNIGFSIVARSIFIGLESAVGEMKQAIGRKP